MQNHEFVDSEVVRLLSKVYAFYEEERHVIMDCPFVPFHTRTCIARHVELQNVSRALMDKPQEHELGIPIVQNRLRGMELGSQLGPQNWQIRPFIQIRSREVKVYSYPRVVW